LRTTRLRRRRRTKRSCAGTSAPASEPLAAIPPVRSAPWSPRSTRSQPSYAPLESAWLGAAGAACFASVGAQSANAGKPDADKLASALEKGGAEARRGGAEDRRRAPRRRTSCSPPPLDIPAFHDAVDEAIDTAISELDGD
jgi:hypothetical protein